MKGRFTDTELIRLEQLAVGRHFLKDQANPDRSVERWANTQHQADFIGVAGEYAVAKFLKIPFDMSINLDGDGGCYDLYLGDWSIQVKASKYKNGRLVFNTMDEIYGAMIFVLVIVIGYDYEIAGCISQKNVLRHVYEFDLGHGKRLCVDQEKLSSINDLLSYHILTSGKKSVP